jgi:hypothetical protein
MGPAKRARLRSAAVQLLTPICKRRISNFDLRAFIVVSIAFLLASVTPRVQADTDLDAFMREVLAHRDENWKKLQQYILDEREQIEVRGSNLLPLWGERHDYTWYIRDGFFVRSPVRFNGVEIGEEERRKYEAEFLRRTQEREARFAPPATPPAAAAAPPSAGSQSSAGDTSENVDGLLRQIREPQFVSSAYFLRFRFEQGKYALVGREMLDGLDVLRIEYYPENLYTDRQRRRMAKDHDPNDPRDREIQRMMNKVALVTLWVEPQAHQIVKYTFDNVDLDFLPARWLVRVGSVRASMTMNRPFPEVWLPRDIEFLADAQLAVGRFDVRWSVEYRDYRQPDVKSNFRVVPGK